MRKDKNRTNNITRGEREAIHTVSWDNTSHRTMGDPGALKFTAIKVRTSPVAPRKEPQIVVISNQTTTRDLITMVIKKCKMDASNAEIVDLLAEYRNEADTDAETETLLDDDRPLLIYDSQPKGTIRKLSAQNEFLEIQIVGAILFGRIGASSLI
ncbi:hypothetical protein CAPTEDRAFT_206204 [Capitella teleta]|uniref:Ras-associating domain-containing protein n=1 Tax=Capitella teleta TaxID=283909 RepID=R7U662_CAPTE|nr:hypothetical protein CAPTEDRAFT_206204 [Capitella teleta]|eukprot:ELU01596.1 hypothetical protein CAPTEDRAFT_206204 [Capitella teleta]